MIEGGDYKGAIAKGREYIPQGKIVCLGIPAWRFEPWIWILQTGGRTDRVSAQRYDRRDPDRRKMVLMIPESIV